jgi:DNA (cytosine-5)-methyltransferase 1
MSMLKRTYLEFFAGGGMARAGLGESWRCLFANDFDQMKVKTYEANWGKEDIRLMGVVSMPGSVARRKLSGAWSGARQSRNPLWDILALLETHPGPGARRTGSARDRS